MKRWFTLTLAGLLALSLTGCGSSAGAGSSAPQARNATFSAPSSVQTAEDPWGLTLSAKDVTLTGLTLVINQQGGSPTGQLQYGSGYTLEVRTGDTWQEVPNTVDGNFAWDDLAYLVTMGGQTEETLTWDWLFGPLSPGHYRLSKRFMDFRGTEDYDTQLYQVEFDIL